MIIQVQLQGTVCNYRPQWAGKYGDQSAKNVHAVLTFVCTYSVQPLIFVPWRDIMSTENTGYYIRDKLLS